MIQFVIQVIADCRLLLKKNNSIWTMGLRYETITSQQERLDRVLNVGTHIYAQYLIWFICFIPIYYFYLLNTVWVATPEELLHKFVSSNRRFYSTL